MQRITLILLLFFSIALALPGVSHATPESSNDHACDNIKLQVLGAGGPEINDGLASSSYLVWINNKARVLVDAGGGSSLNFEKSGADFNDLQVMLLSHFHVDHSAAIPVYLMAGYFTHRETSLPVFGPVAGGDYPSTEAFINALISDKQPSVYPYLSDNLYQQASTDFLVFPHSVKATNDIWQKTINENISIKAIAVHHGNIPALAWRVESGQCSITFSGDMNGSSNHLPMLAKNTNILIAHNAIPQQASGGAKWLHMTPQKIGEIAQQAQVKKLMLSHFMLRTIDRKQESKQFIKKAYKGKIIEAKELQFTDL